MSKSGNRKSRRRQLQASHQKNWLIGRHAVLETLRAAQWPIHELLLADTVDAEVALQVRQLADAGEYFVEEVSVARIEELCSAKHHQGVAARMAPYPYETVPDLLASLQPDAQEDSGNADEAEPLIVICDRIQDSFNFGAILRSCDAMAVHAVVIAEANQTGVTPQVVRSSSGAVNFLNVVLSEDLVETCRQLKGHGFTIAAATEKADVECWQQKLASRTVLIVGSEAHGVSEELLSVCDVQLRIPMLGHVESLNAAVATGVLLYEIRRQQTVIHG